MLRKALISSLILTSLLLGAVAYSVPHIMGAKAETSAIVAPATPRRVQASEAIADNPNPPATTIKLVFLHHSVGDALLDTGDGGLGNLLGANNYYVSDTYYEWGPDEIGSSTDIGDWWTWFRGPESARYMEAAYSTTNTHASYTRPMADPGGENTIVMFKSCYPNSHVGGLADDPPTIGANPLREEGAYSEHHTVGNAKGIYNDILQYFQAHQDKLFIVITAPPLHQDDRDFPTDATHAANARALNNWLVNDWLSSYPYSNVAVFDLYNVLTSNGGDSSTNDLGAESGNHHRWWLGAIQHVQTVSNNFAAYGGDRDSHPQTAGCQKASSEFIKLLNVYTHRWLGGSVSQTPAPTATDTSGATATVTSTPSGTLASEVLLRLPLILKGYAPNLRPTATPTTGTPTVTPDPSHTTWYIRPDGGSPEQCTGRVDAAYPGSGSNQPCAWDHPFRALPPNGSPRISGGDTVIIGSGSYMMGYGARGDDGCESDYPWDCHMQPPPSGPDPSHPTRLLGAGWDSGCTSPPELWGTERTDVIIDLTDASNVEIACLEITDHSACVEDHTGGLACNRDQYPHGPWAVRGVYAEDSENVRLKHLNIHGLANAGIHAGRLTNWTVEDVRIAGNGWVGWDGDVDGSDSNSGTMLFRRWTVEWNGCAETYPGDQPTGCWAQTAGGYGDGVGTGATGGDWIIEDSAFLHNTSDGLDLLYHSLGGQIVLNRVRAEGNAGNQIKITGDGTIANSVLVGNCAFFEGQPFTHNVDPCRALGNTLAVVYTGGEQISIVNSTLYGQGDGLIIGGPREGYACNGSETLVGWNNIFLGDSDFLDPGDRTFLFYQEGCAGQEFDSDYSLYHGVKLSLYVPGSHDIAADPQLAGPLSGQRYGMELSPQSPAINRGTSQGAPLVDIDGLARDAQPDMGAYEWRSASGTATATSTQSTEPPPATPTPTSTRTTAATARPTVTSSPSVWNTPTASPSPSATTDSLCSGPEPTLITDKLVRQATPIAEPAPRVPFRDPVFGTCLVRVTDRSSDPDPEDPSPGMGNEYARVQSFNADGSLLLGRGTEGTWYLYDAQTLLPLRRLPLEIEPRWDAEDADTVYYSDETRLLSYNIQTEQATQLRDFALDLAGQTIYAVWTRHEGSPSRDTRYWALMAENSEWIPVAFLVYDRTTDGVTIRDMRAVPGIADDVDHVTMSPLGNYFIASFDRACAEGALGSDSHPCGLMVYNRDLSNGRSLLRTIGHYDPVLDAGGREVIVYQGIDTDHISMLDLASGAVTPLWEIDFGHTAIGFHFSGVAYDRPGWAVVSTHDDDAASHTWMDDQVFLVELKSSGRIVRLAHTHSIVDENQPFEYFYWAEPHASANRDLTRILFTTNWGRYSTGEVEMYMIDLPPDWLNQLP